MSADTFAVLAEQARAKVNWTLRILGKRADGFHELDSVVAFAGIADVVTLTVGAPVAVAVHGPFGGLIEGDNLALRALAAAKAARPDLKVGALTIEKHLPVAAGLGGGSADAAAVLRLLRRANPRMTAHVDWLGLAAELGSDVPVCLLSRTCRMRGRGERLGVHLGLPAMAVVLVNPRVAVPADKTRQVFRHLAAPSLPADQLPPPRGVSPTNRNDLQDAASAVVPAIADVLSALRGNALTLEARLSGAGPTCFARTATMADAYQLAQEIAATHPTWWARATTLG